MTPDAFIVAICCIGGAMLLVMGIGVLFDHFEGKRVDQAEQKPPVTDWRNLW